MKLQKLHYAVFAFLNLSFLVLFIVKLDIDHRHFKTLPNVAKVIKHQINKNYGKLPLCFEANQGQVNKQVKFLSRGSGYNLFLTPNETVLAFNSSLESQNGAVLKMKIVDANLSPTIFGLAELPSKSNYFKGENQQNWHANIPNYAKVQYKNIYPGIDLMYYGNQGKLEYDFIVSPGVNPSKIKLAYEGITNLNVSEAGDLILYLAEGNLCQHKPVVYQEIEGEKHFVSGNYIQTGQNQVGIQLTDYDVDESLVIDPVLSYSTYIGGSNTESGQDIAVDASGNAYIIGTTNSLDFPTANPIQPLINGSEVDIYVLKLNATGTALVYSTFIGGTGLDIGNSIAIDNDDNVYITGSTNSTNYPVINAFQASNNGNDEIFVTKLSTDGSALVYSTYLGGSSVDVARGISVDALGNAYLTGYTSSTDFPTANPLQGVFGGGGSDAFVSKFNVTGSVLDYSTFIGGSGSDFGFSLYVDASNNAYLTGGTYSTDFPTENPIQSNLTGNSDVYVSKINAEGSAFLFSTFIGGNNNDWSHDIAVDNESNAYITGSTSSSDFPTINAYQSSLIGGQTDAFVTKVNASGSALTYSTYLGGSGSRDGGGSIAVDHEGNAYVTGHTNSSDFPTKFPIQATFQSIASETTDVFISKFNQSGSILTFSTYLGGVREDQGMGIAVDAAGNAYITGYTFSVNFPIVNSFQGSIGGGGYSDAFIAKIGQMQFIYVLIDIKPGSDPNSINLDAEGVIPVAILTTPEFDAATVDPFTLVMEGASVKLKGKSGNGGSLEDVDNDGDLDLVVQIYNETNLEPGDTEATLMGQTYDGTMIMGVDAIRIVPPGSSKPIPKDESIDSSELPEKYCLGQNSPNPFNPETEISFGLPAANNVILKIYNALGEEICTLANGPYGAGYHRIRWDGRNNAGRSVPSGMYFYQLKAKSQIPGKRSLIDTKRMILMK